VFKVPDTESRFAATPLTAVFRFADELMIALFRTLDTEEIFPADAFRLAETLISAVLRFDDELSNELFKIFDVAVSAVFRFEDVAAI
jgi:hypothetical protein